MTGPADLTRMVPGFDFLQGLLKNAGGALPGIGQWVAPTLNPEELDKRIQELKTVHFWLEQNARLLATTIQALEVQRMTLSTLQNMNLPLADLAASLRAKAPEVPEPPAPRPAPEPAAPARRPAARKASSPGKPGPASGPSAVDPMQWWSALTQQFTELATKAVKEGVGEGAARTAGSAVQPPIDEAGGAPRKVAGGTRPAAGSPRRAAPRKR